MQIDGGAVSTQIETQLPNFIVQDHPKFAKFIEKYYEFLELNLLTFTDLNLNEHKIIQESDNVTYSVTVATGNNAYSNSVNKFWISSTTPITIANTVSPVLTVSTGVTYVFDQSHVSNALHPLRFSTLPDGHHSASGEAFSNNVVVSGTLGTAGAQTVIYFPPDDNLVSSEISLYYHCNTHSGMGGNITVANTTPFISLENGNVTTTNTNSNYIDLENPNKQGDQFLSGEQILGKTTGATGVVRGKYSTTQVYVEETNSGSFSIGETITGNTSRATAIVNTYSRQPLNASRNLKTYQDIDKAPKGFVELFRKEFLHGLSVNLVANKAKVLKHIKDFYRAKGNEASFQYIFRLLYGKEDVTFYYPSTDILRLSDGRWTLDKTVKINNLTSNNFSVFEGRRIVGSVTNVSAVIEKTTTYQVGALTISELFVSNFDANTASYNANTDSGWNSFLAGETITTTTADTSGNYGSATISGILESITIDSGGSNYSVGDELTVSSGGGKEAAVKVGAVSDATISAFDIIDAGDGYTIGDAVTFVNEGTGGAGASARVQTIVPTANISVATQIIDTFKEDQINATTYAAPFNTKNANDHLSSNSITTFTVAFDGVVGTAPKKGDYITAALSRLTVEGSGTNFNEGDQYITEQAPVQHLVSGQAFNEVFGTIIDVTDSNITYALGSITFSDDNKKIITIDDFLDNETITIYDLSKTSAGTAISANGYDAALTTTGGTFDINGTPVANTDTNYYGTLIMAEKPVGAIRSLQVLSSGQGYTTIPVVSVANSITVAYGNAPEKLGANSIFLTLANTVANDFLANTIIKNDGNTATGLVLDFIDKPTSLVGSGNTVLRVQMTAGVDFGAGELLTTYTNNDAQSLTGIGDLAVANVAVSLTTATFTQATHGLTIGQRINVTGASTGNEVYDGEHTVVGVTNTSTYTATFGSAPPSASQSNLNVRRIITANTAYERLLTEATGTNILGFEDGTVDTVTVNGYMMVESGIDTSNVVFANTGVAGNNAVISISSIAIGAIQSLTIYNFGAGYSAAPTIDSSQVGDGNATLTAKLGALAEYEGYFAGTRGLLSDQGKLQDNFYYQDFSYVIKTDVGVSTYRDKITELVHPAGMAMFGEVAMLANTAVKMFANGATTENSTQVSADHGISIPYYRFHEITIANQNTASSNVQITIAATLYRPKLFPPTLLDVRVNYPSVVHDIQLEHGNDNIALEDAGSYIIMEHNVMLQEEFEGQFIFLVSENGDNLVSENGDTFYYLSGVGEPAIPSGDTILNEDGTTVNVEGDVYLLDELDGNFHFPVEGFYNSLIQENVDPNVADTFELEIGGSTGGISTIDEDLLLLEDGSEVILEDVYKSRLVLEGVYTFVESTLGTDLPYSRNFLYAEDEVNHLKVSSEDHLDPFYIQMEYDGEELLIRLEDAVSDGYLLQEDVVPFVALYGYIRTETRTDIDFILFEPTTVYADGTTAGVSDELLLEQPVAEGYPISLALEGISGLPVSYTGAVEGGDQLVTDNGYNLVTQSQFWIGSPLEFSLRGRLTMLEATTGANDLMIFERYEIKKDAKISIDERLEYEGFTLPQLEFPQEEVGATFIDMGYGSQIRLETDTISSISQEFGILQHCITESRIDLDFLLFEPTTVYADGTTAGASDEVILEQTAPNGDPISLTFEGVSGTAALYTGAVEGGDTFVWEDGNGILYDHGHHTIDGEIGLILLEDGGLLLNEDQPVEAEGFQYDMLLLEADEGAYPMYLATEDTMTEEVIYDTEVAIIPKYTDHNSGMIIGSHFGVDLDNNKPYIRERLIERSSFSQILLERNHVENDGVLILETGSDLLLEKKYDHLMAEGTINTGTEDESSIEGFQFVYEHTPPQFIDVPAARITNAVNLAAGSGKAVSGYMTQGSGQVQLKNSEDYELLAEDGRRLVTESLLEETQIIAEDGRLYKLEHDEDIAFITSHTVAGPAGRVLLRAEYTRDSEAIGTSTEFETDLNSIIILEDNSGVIELESYTPQDYLILLENEIGTITLEENTTGGPGQILQDDAIVTTTKRLVFEDLKDLILEDEGIALEQPIYVETEDYTTADEIVNLVTENGNQLDAENGNNLVSEEVGIGNINIVHTFDLKIGDFVPSIGLEYDVDDGEIPGGIILEDYTTRINDHWLTEDEKRLVVEHTSADYGSDYITLLLEGSYAASWSEGTIQQISDTITLTGSEWPHGVDDDGVLYYADGSTANVTSRVISSDFQRITVDKVKTISADENYIIHYGRYLTSHASQDTDYLKCEFNADETTATYFNDIGKGYLYHINGMVDHEGTAGGVSIPTFEERLGNDIVYEDGERILTEDGEVDHIAIEARAGETIYLVSENGDNLVSENGDNFYYSILPEVITLTNVIKLEDGTGFLAMEEDDEVLLEDKHLNYRLLNFEGTRYMVDYIANNTFLKVSSGETPHITIDTPILVERFERVTT